MSIKVDHQCGGLAEYAQMSGAAETATNAEANESTRASLVDNISTSASLARRKVKRKEVKWRMGWNDGTSQDGEGSLISTGRA